MSDQQSNQTYDVPSTLIGAKRVRAGEKDAKERDRTVLTFDAQQTSQLAQALLGYANEGKQVNFDVRVGEATSKAGKVFPTAFCLVKEMIPKSVSEGTTFVPTTSRADELKANADKIRAEVEGK